MATTESRKKTGAQEHQDELNELLQKALQQPGVQDVMYVYETWRRIDEASRPCFQAMAQRPAVSFSNTTSPTFTML
jgi:hypothetical protein